MTQVFYISFDFQCLIYFLVLAVVNSPRDLFANSAQSLGLIKFLIIIDQKDACQFLSLYLLRLVLYPE